MGKNGNRSRHLSLIPFVFFVSFVVKKGGIHHEGHEEHEGCRKNVLAVVFSLRLWLNEKRTTLV